MSAKRETSRWHRILDALGLLCWWDGHVAEARSSYHFRPWPGPTPLRCTRCGNLAGYRCKDTGAFYNSLHQFYSERCGDF